MKIIIYLITLLIISLSLGIFVSNIRKITKGECSCSCSGCASKHSCSNSRKG